VISGILPLRLQEKSMPQFNFDLDPCDHITADAIGQPGNRVFYIQAFQAERSVVVIIEKIQLQSLAVGIEQFLGQLATQNPNLAEASAQYYEDHMRIHPPVEPLFRVGEIGLGYDRVRDRLILITHEVIMEGDDPEEASTIRFWCTRDQARALARWGQEVVKQGRPICAQCGQPMEPEGHFCPKKNGHKQ
jgi:uncharacterized repeat protein (TIGR03847 family)